MIHRDIKPDNILLERATGRALVTDFGIVRTAAAADAGAPGEVTGTPLYMSPEQGAGDAVDGRSDLYSLGVVAFFAVTGRVPFDGDNANAILAQHLTREPPRLAELRPDLPGELVRAIDTLLVKDPADRFASGEALVEALDALRSARPEVAPSIRLFLARAPALAIGALAIAWVGPVFVTSREYDADRAVLSALFITVFVGLVVRLGVGVRALAEQGFGYAAFRRAVVAATLERRSVRLQRRLAPRWLQRRRLRARTLALGFALSAVVLWVVRANRTYRADGLYSITRVGLMLAVAGSAGAMTVLWIVFADVVAAVTSTPISHRIWTGAIGRAIYHVATRGLPDHPESAPSMSPVTR